MSQGRQAAPQMGETPVTWMLRTLGGLALESPAGAPLPGVAQQRSRLALLAAIASAGRSGISRDRLLAMFWPEHDTEHARAALKQAIYVLRRDLGGAEVIGGTAVLRLDRTRLDADVLQFEDALRDGDLPRAVGWYQGRFLAGVHVANSEFEHWRDDEDRRLHALHLRALDQLASGASDRDDHAGAVHWRRVALQADPLSGRATGALMRALLAAGDSSGALEQAQLHARLVRDQLESPPDEAVVSLEAEIRRSHARPAPPAGSPPIETSPVDAAPPAGSPPIETPPVDAAPPAGSPPIETPPVDAAPPAGSPPIDTRRVDASQVPEREPSPPPAAPSLVARALPPVTRRRGTSPARWQMGSLALAVLSALFLLRVAPDTLHVRIDDPGHALPAADDTQRAIARGIIHRLPQLSHGTWWRGRAHYHVTIRASTREDSVQFVIDATHAGDAPIVVRAAARTAASVTGQVADAVAMRIAASRHPLLSRWYARTGGMTNWEGQRALEEALARWQPFGPATNPEVFDRVLALDSTSGTPMVLKALGQLKSNRRTDAESTLVQLAREQRRLGPWDRAVLSVLDAWRRNDLAAAHQRGHVLDALVPGSEWAILVAYDALGVGRANESLEIMKRLPPGVPWTEHWVRVNRHQALLMLGDHASALRDAEGWLLSAPEDRFFQQTAAKALAGLGRTAEVEALCRRSLTLRFDWQPCTQAIMELRYHGHTASARTLADAFIAALAASDSIGSVDLIVDRAGALMDAGAWEEARRELARVPRDHRSAAFSWYTAATAAERGDRETMDSAMRSLALGPEEALVDRANIAALIGDKARAVELLSSAYRHGSRRGFALGAWAGLDRLRGYPPFDSLVAPVRDAHDLEVLAPGTRTSVMTGAR